MNVDEVLRRLRRMIALPIAKRPISIMMLERIAGVSHGMTYEILAAGRMTEKMRVQYERALTWLENDQVKLTHTGMDRTHGRKTQVAIGPPKPPQLTISTIKFKPGGPQIRRVAVNPRAFPELEGADE